MDFSKDTFFTSKPHLFYDYRHLNNDGVEIFSKQVLNDIINHSK